MKTLLLPLSVLAALLTAAVPSVLADDSTQSKTILVDEGGSYEVPVHPDYVTVFYFPDKITKAVASDPKSYEVKSLGDTSLAIRPLSASAKPANLNIATASIHVSVVLSIASDRAKALTQVTFKRADVEAEVQKRIDAAVAARTKELEDKVAAMKRQMDADLPQVAEGLIAERILHRRELRKLKAIERNDDNVIVRVTEALYLGDDAYLVFNIQNRDNAPYRLATVEVLAGDRDVGRSVRFTSTAAETAGKGIIGVVAPGSFGDGVVVVPHAADVVGKSVTLVIEGPKGAGKVSIDGIELR